jgi:phosphate starvation-inducible protein PhoH and related proteins
LTSIDSKITLNISIGAYLDDSITIVLDNRDLLPGICGANDGNLKVIEGSLGGRIAARGNEIRLEGADVDAVRRFRMLMDNLIALVKEGENPSPEYVLALTGTGNPTGSPAEEEAFIHIPNGFGRVYPKSKNQAAYIRGMRNSDISFGIGPAGTGKTYLAVAQALSLVLSKKMRKLVLTRPVVEAGESLGFLPGDLAQKINPYLRPLYDAMESLIPFEIIHRMEENRTIEIAPLAYMRGRSLNDCMVILDEAQNTTKEQMKMFLTRIGQGARAVVTGDITQIDLPRRNDSGLLNAISILSDIEGLHFSYLHTTDVVRNPLVRKIIQAYERTNTEKSQKIAEIAGNNNGA